MRRKPKPKKRDKKRKRRMVFPVVEPAWFDVAETDVNDEDLVRYWKAGWEG